LRLLLEKEEIFEELDIWEISPVKLKINRKKSCNRRVFLSLLLNSEQKPLYIYS
jgi:hypothetical protein